MKYCCMKKVANWLFQGSRITGDSLLFDSVTSLKWIGFIILISFNVPNAEL